MRCQLSYWSPEAEPLGICFVGYPAENIQIAREHATAPTLKSLVANRLKHQEELGKMRAAKFRSIGKRDQPG